MGNDEIPTLDVELGLSPNAEPSLSALFQRCRERLKLLASGRAELSHLLDEGVFWRSRVVVKDGLYQLVVPIDAGRQTDFEGFQGKRGKAARVRQEAEAQQEAVDRTVDGVQANSELVARVAETMSTAQDSARELHHLESKEGVDTGPARRYIQKREGDFFVNIESTCIPFRSAPVRSSQQVGGALSVIAKLVQQTSTASIERCHILEVMGGQVMDGLTVGGRKEMRFADLQPWQRLALVAAREFDVPVQLHAVNRIGTCSLEFRPADVVKVDNWRGMVAAGLKGLRGARAGLARSNSPEPEPPGQGAPVTPSDTP